jgi:hypothetical protein
VLARGKSKGSVSVLKMASAALRCGDVERGWKCVQSARRLELFVDGADIKAAATVIRSEADKLSTWRRNAVIELLTVREPEKLNPETVFTAALLRDEHFNNEAYKDGLRRGDAFRLALVLVSVLLALLWLSDEGYLRLLATDELPSIGAADLFGLLLSVATVGLLGSTISAITDVPRRQGSVRIPEMASSIRVTMLRLLVGPASAIVVYFGIRSQLYNAIFKVHPDGWTILIISFVAGFIERLVQRVVQIVAGSPSS